MKHPSDVSFRNLRYAFHGHIWRSCCDTVDLWKMQPLWAELWTERMFSLTPDALWWVHTLPAIPHTIISESYKLHHLRMDWGGIEIDCYSLSQLHWTGLLTVSISGALWVNARRLIAAWLWLSHLLNEHYGHKDEWLLFMIKNPVFSFFIHLSKEENILMK